MNVLRPKESLTANGVPAQVDLEDVFVFSTSFAQQRLWFLDQYGPHSSLYNVPVAFHLKGLFQLTALTRAVNEIVFRHEALRTTFSTSEEKELVQVVAQSLSVNPQMFDLRELAGKERDTEVNRILVEEVHRPFELSRGPLLRVAVIQLSRDEHVLLLITHHIVSDGWSMDNLLRELSMLYADFCVGQPSSLPDLPIQFADFALWQRESLTGDLLDRQFAYWKTQLNGMPALLDLPTDRPRPPVQRFRGAHQAVFIPPELSDALKAMSRHEGVTLFMTLLAAFQTLLHRYSRQDDIVVGSPIAGRNRAEVEDLIGFFANTLVLRTDLSGDPAFRELLQRVRDVALQAYAHQDLPFEKLVEKLQPQRNRSYTPLFQVMFALHTPSAELSLPGLAISSLEVATDTAKFDLTLALVDEPKGLRGFLEYNTDLFDASTIERMLGHFQALLQGIGANPEQHLSQLPLLTDDEKQHLLAERGSKKADFSRSECVHEIFEAQVLRTPDKVAVVFQNQELTYQQLNRLANQVARQLQALGVAPESLVGIYTERSLEMIVAILGVLKAGGAYVPLDPVWPRERLSFMMADSQVKVVLTQNKLMARLQLHDTQVLCLDTLSQTDGLQASATDSNPLSGATANNLAYVIYTSGSTGTPKGALLSHYNVTRLFHATHSWFRFDENDVWTLFHSYAFDFSVWEIWGALLYGGKLVIVPYRDSRSPEMFYNLLREEKVTVLNQTPSAFRQLIEIEPSLGKGQELALRLVIFGGETLDFLSLKPWFDRHGDQTPRLINMYGITETTVHVTYRPITVADLAAKGKSFIGVPIPDLELYALDQNQNPLPIGVPGELYVGGAGVARGYLNRSELTNERFISNPFTCKSGERFYRSGDLVRLLPNRDIEYLGRMDHQVKIRGFRIELGEIEAALTQHFAVKQVVVTVCENDPGDKRLVAYVVPEQESLFHANDLRNYVREKLPDYMVPSALVQLDSFPLTSNGKLDRDALPAPNFTARDDQRSFVAPQTELERTIATIWQKLLRIEEVGVHDNFFDLGGHSLLLIQLHSHLTKAVEVKLSIIDLFEYSTIYAMARYLNRRQLGCDSLPRHEPSGENVEQRRLRIARQRQQRQQLSSGE
jgi:amino acid adenylation domain-containing protein